MEGGQREQLTGSTICSAIGGVIGFGLVVFGALMRWASLIPGEEGVGLVLVIFGALFYLSHILEALCRSKTSKYLSYILTETEFQGYVKEVQQAKPKIMWTIQNYHYEEKRTRDKDGKEHVERKRVNTHRAVGQYDINSFMDETLSPEQMIAMFHLMFDGENQDLEANKTKAVRIFLLCEMPLEYHPFDDGEEQRLNQNREAFYRDNTRDTHQDKSSQDLIELGEYKSHVMVVLKENTDDSTARPWWMHYWVFVICTIFLMSVPYRCYFFSQCKKVQWEVLKHFSHQPEGSEIWKTQPRDTRAKRTDAASRAFRGVKRETNQPSLSGNSTAWEEGKGKLEDVGPPVQVPVGVPSYWKNQDLSKEFDEKINLSAEEKEKMQKLLDVTFKDKATRDRKSGEMPTRLLVNQAIRMEDSKMWMRFEQKRAELGIRGQPKLIKEMPGSGAFKTSLEELPLFLTELTADLNEAYLFHGSCPGGALGIGENGFDMGRVGSNVGTMFGAGAYMAEASSKSDEYATEDPSGLFAGKFALLLCRTLLGNMFYITESNIPRIEDALKTGRFQCVLGDREAAVDTYREFVVFDEAQIYPEYVIIYSRSFD